MNFTLSIPQSPINVQSDVLFNIQELPVSNAMLSGVLLTLLVFIATYFLITKVKPSGVPSKFQVFIEMIYDGFYKFISSIAGSDEVAKQIISIIGTVFIYIGISNILLSFPIIDSITYTLGEGSVSLLRPHTADINTTFGIAATMVIWTHILSIKKINLYNHLNKYIKINNTVKQFKKGVSDGLISLIDLLLLGPLDIISEVAKSLSLSLRLLGNMLSGLIMGAMLLSTIALVLPVPLTLYGYFTGGLQALIFGALSSSYFGSALAEE